MTVGVGLQKKNSPAHITVAVLHTETHGAQSRLTLNVGAAPVEPAELVLALVAILAFQTKLTRRAPSRRQWLGTQVLNTATLGTLTRQALFIAGTLFSSAELVLALVAILAFQTKFTRRAPSRRQWFGTQVLNTATLGTLTRQALFIAGTLFSSAELVLALVAILAFQTKLTRRAPSRRQWLGTQVLNTATLGTLTRQALFIAGTLFSSAELVLALITILAFQTKFTRRAPSRRQWLGTQVLNTATLGTLTRQALFIAGTLFSSAELVLALVAILAFQTKLTRRAHSRRQWLGTQVLNTATLGTLTHPALFIAGTLFSSAELVLALITILAFQTKFTRRAPSRRQWLGTQVLNTATLGTLTRQALFIAGTLFSSAELVLALITILAFQTKLTRRAPSRRQWLGTQVLNTATLGTLTRQALFIAGTLFSSAELVLALITILAFQTKFTRRAPSRRQWLGTQVLNTAAQGTPVRQACMVVRALFSPADLGAARASCPGGLAKLAVRAAGVVIPQFTLVGHTPVVLTGEGAALIGRSARFAVRPPGLADVAV